MWPLDQAVELDPGEVTYPANRANVHLRMKSWQEAENDSTAALTINPKYAKVQDDINITEILINLQIVIQIGVL